MGLSIHYNGRFKSTASLLEMIEEVEDIANIYKWKYIVHSKNFPKKVYDDNSHNNKIYGIAFIPPKCEPVFLSFLSNRRMSSDLALKFWGKSTDKNEKKYLYMLSTKTQYAGRNVHKIIIHLLKYLGKKYFSEFELHDEGHYWETNDEKVLDENFDRYKDLIDSFGFALDNVPMNSNETIEEYFSRIIKIIRGKNLK